MKAFFIDTADDAYIRQAWAKLSEHFDVTDLCGITTNPNAMAKVGAHSLADWERVTRRLCATMDQLRPVTGGVVYVQAPVSTMSQRELLTWAEKISSWRGNITQVGMKIPPFKKALEIVRDLSHELEINVTGVADVSTALMAASYGVRYVSVIPGRMEERGIDAKAQVSYLMQSDLRTTQIIAGSMRTKEGLKWVTEYGTVPTVGTRVLDLYLADNSLAEFAAYFNHQFKSLTSFSPPISPEQTKLSVEFFEQMDGLGAQVYKEFA